MNISENETKWNKFSKEKAGFQSGTNIPNGSLEEQLDAIKNMRKYKNNYSNIELFENIYDTTHNAGTATPETTTQQPRKSKAKERNPYNTSCNSCSDTGTCDVPVENKKSDNTFRLFNDDSELISKLMSEMDKQEGFSSKDLGKGKADMLLNQTENVLNKLEPKAAEYAVRHEIYIRGTRQINPDDARVVGVNVYYKFKKFINKLIDKSEVWSNKYLNMLRWFDKPAEKFVRASIKRDKPRPSEKNINNDIYVIKSFMKDAVCFPLAILMTYNWVYLIMFKSINACEAGSSEECRPARDDVRAKIDFTFMNVNIQVNYVLVSKIMNYFFDMAIKPVEYMDRVLLGDNFLPKLFGFKMVPRVLYNIIILLFCYMVLILTNKKYIFRIVNIVIIIVHFIHTFSDYAFTTLSMSMGNAAIFVMGMAGIFFSRAIIAYHSINVSVYMCMIYFFLHSFFGMFMYSMKGVNYLSVFRYIDDFIRKDVSYKEKDHYSRTEPIVKFIYDVLSIIGKYLYLIAFLIVYLALTIRTGVRLKTVGVKYNITLINIFVLLVTFAYLVYKMLKKYDDGIVYKYNVDKRENIIVRSKDTSTGGSEDGDEDENSEDEGENEGENGEDKEYKGDDKYKYDEPDCPCEDENEDKTNSSVPDNGDTKTEESEPEKSETEKSSSEKSSSEESKNAEESKSEPNTEDSKNVEESNTNTDTTNTDTNTASTTATTDNSTAAPSPEPAHAAPAPAPPAPVVPAP